MPGGRSEKLGVAFACAVGRSAKLLQSFKGLRGFKRFKRFRGFKGLRAGKRQAWTPIRSHGCGLGIPLGISSTELRTLGPGKWCILTP